MIVPNSVVTRRPLVATVIAATLAFVIAIGVFAAVAELFLRDGIPWQHAVVVESRPGFGPGHV
jgi:hypothetical protein